MENPKFLKQKYNLQNTPEVQSATKRTEKRTGEKLSQDPNKRIQNYLNRFKEIIERKDPEKRERGMRALKDVLHDKFVIKDNEVPESYFENQRRIAREQGHGDIEISAEMREQLTEVIITDQESTLDAWIDYLTSPDAMYPDWLKYWAFRSVLGMGNYDKEKKQFTKRTETTTKPFPDINREALAYILDAVSQKYGKRHMDLLALGDEEKEEFEKLLQSENFAKLYAWAIDKLTIGPTESLENIQGKWIKYLRNSDHTPLVRSLQGFGTGWCTAGESTAQAQLKGGDFYAYYSLDKNGKPNIPRAAIRMQENQIAEVRGVAPEQNLDPFIAPVVQDKLREFPDGRVYEKKVHDMKRLTAVEVKVKEGHKLTKDDLVFMYEINFPIEGFGYQKDPRIAELRSQRNAEEDMLIVLECSKEQIAHNAVEINMDTRAYLGTLESGIFDRVKKYSIEHVFTSFPEGKIRYKEIRIGGKPSEQLEKELKEKKIIVTDYAQDLLRSKEFATLKNRERIQLVRLKVRDLGFKNGATTQEIYQKAAELGLDLCPAEVGPNLRFQYMEQPLGEYFWVAMKQIADRDRGPSVFGLVHGTDGLWLSGGWAEPGGRWYPGDEFVFCLRK